MNPLGAPALLSVGALGVSGLAVFASRRRVLQQRWLSWALILPTLWLVLAAGALTTTVLAVLLGGVAVREYARLVAASRGERWVLLAAALLGPLLALLAPDWLRFAPLLLVASALPALLDGDTETGLQRSAVTAFGALWIGWSLAHLVLGWQHAYLVLLAVAGADVGAWCLGTGLRRFSWAARPLTPLSPAKTWGGVLGSVLGAGLVFALAGRFEPALVLVVGLGAVIGDLIESMAKRQAGVKDTGSWLPGFGGLLDRIDSLLVVLPLTALVTALGTALTTGVAS